MSPGVTVPPELSELLTAKLAVGTNVKVSEELVNEFVSVVPAGAVTVPVSVIVPVALGLIVPDIK